MGKRKKNGDEEGNGKDYDIQIGFILDFSFRSPRHKSALRGHPAVGRCYRLIKDHDGYRLHIGRENNDMELDGLFLGESLSGERPEYSFEIELVTPENYLTLPIHKEDYEKIGQWLTDGNKDLWDRISLERSGEATVIKTPVELLSLMAARGFDPRRSHNIPKIKSQQDFKSQNDLAEALNVITDNDKDLLGALAKFIGHLSNTYEDKYEANKGMANFSKWIATESPELGKGANLFNAMKYLQRYSTTGFSKSEDVKDLYKAAHYILFEIQRRSKLDD